MARAGVRGRVRDRVGERRASVEELVRLAHGCPCRPSSGFPQFKVKHRTTPAFRLRARSAEGELPSVRPTGPKSVRFPKLGELRVRESTKQLRRLLGSGRFHAYAAAFRFEHGHWVVSITGVAAQFHHARRHPAGRHQARVGVDLGVKTLAVAVDEHGTVLATWEGVKALQHAQARLRLANQAFSRTKRGSVGRTKAARRLGRIHARVAALRKHLLHEVTTTLAAGCTSLVVEDLNVAGMVANHRLARSLSDASFGELRRQLQYKTAWYGTELIVADRWFASSRLCSNCGQHDPGLTLADRVYRCVGCGLVSDRDVNAAINLARYAPPASTTEDQPQLGAA